jgi:hypothetical protein
VDFAATSTCWPGPLDEVASDWDGGAGVDVDVEFSAPSVNVVSEAGTEAIPGVGAVVRLGADVAAPPPAGGTTGGPAADVDVPGSVDCPGPDGSDVCVPVGDSRPGGDPLGCPTPPPMGGGDEVPGNRPDSDVTGGLVGCGPCVFVPSCPLGEAVGEPGRCFGSAWSVGVPWWWVGLPWWCDGVPWSPGLDDRSSLGEQLGEPFLPAASTSLESSVWLGASVVLCPLCGQGHGACEEGLLHDSCPPRSAPAPDPGSRAANAMPEPRQTAATSVRRRRSPRVIVRLYPLRESVWPTTSASEKRVHTAAQRVP